MTEAASLCQDSSSCISILAAGFKDEVEMDRQSSTPSSAYPTTQNNESSWAPADERGPASRRAAPDSEAERLRLRAKYNERLKERTVQIYRRALEGVIEEEKRCSMLRITFVCAFQSRFGQNIYLVGSESFLGNWDCDKSILMQWHQGNLWKCTISIPSGCKRIQYKYIIKEGGCVTWEAGPNRICDCREISKSLVPFSGQSSSSIHGNNNSISAAVAATGAAAAGQVTPETCAAVFSMRPQAPIEINDVWERQ